MKKHSDVGIKIERSERCEQHLAELLESIERDPSLARLLEMAWHVGWSDGYRDGWMPGRVRTPNPLY